MRLMGRSAVVTGGASGLGEGIARRFAEEGAAVAIVDRNGARGIAIASEIDPAGRRAIAVTADLTDTTAIAGAMSLVADAFGGVDILVNSAGIFEVSTLEATTEAVWDRHLDLNVKALFFCCQAVAPGMKARGFGRIINLTSIAGLVAFLDCPAYCASKGAIVNLTRALACELAPYGISVNAIAPGPVETPINDQFEYASPKGDAHRRFLSERTPSGVSYHKVDDVTGTALFLASNESSAVTGTTIPVDGGWTAW